MKAPLKFVGGAFVSILVMGGVMFFFSQTDSYFYLVQRIFWGNEFLTISEAEREWGRKPFDPTEFRAGKNRKEMVVDLIERKILIDKSYGEVKQLLGEIDGGYFESDEVLTYRIFSSDFEAFSLLVLTDQKGGVRHVYIWKDWKAPS